MGCGPSQLEGGPTSDQRPGDKPAQNGTVQNGAAPNHQNKRVSSTDANANNRTKTNTDQTPVPRSVAFTVDLEGEKTDNKLLGPPPPRLKRLDPLNVPKLTADELAEKQRLADQKREEQLQRRQSASVKSSRRRQQILDAQKFEAEQLQTTKEQEIQESLTSAGKSRETKLNLVKEKQQIREQRAKRARERVKKLNELDQDLDIEVEKDEDYNADEVDSWLDGDNNNNNNNNDMISADSGERIYNGRTSPKKQFNPEGNNLRRGISANTIDSFDNAYNRKPPSGVTRHQTIKDTENHDDFFDT